ncbi:hypothetical protein Tco_1112095 [Tanacetum coccineum]|uniref:Reverse transcriptase domain-containing protein n=1 Tax=Tanacetum coccineum TaxID=301880 RepID=A0ABQ5IQQ2_9ASTR
MAPKRKTTRLNPDATPTPDRDATRNGDDSHTSGGTEGVVGLTQWFEKMESVYSISNCTVACQDIKKDDDRQITTQGGEIKELEFEMWNLKVKGNDVDSLSSPTVTQDKKINTWAERQADNKRKSDDTARNNQNQQPNKRQNTGRAYATGNGDRRPYGGPRPLCSKCNYHHDASLNPPMSTLGLIRGVALNVVLKGIQVGIAQN